MRHNEALAWLGATLTPEAGAPVLTFLGILQIVRSIAEAAEVLGQPDAGTQFLVEDVAFVHEQHELDVREEFVGAYSLPKDY